MIWVLSANGNTDHYIADTLYRSQEICQELAIPNIRLLRMMVRFKPNDVFIPTCVEHKPASPA